MRQIIIRLLVAAAIASGFILGGMATAVPTDAADDVSLTSTQLALVSSDNDDDDDHDDDDDDDDHDDDDDDGILGILFL
ncbi:MAG: hypothetical protein ACRDRH_14770 [Pseudonocardia sp.]